MSVPFAGPQCVTGYSVEVIIVTDCFLQIKYLDHSTCIIVMIILCTSIIGDRITSAPLDAGHPY